jgi:signal transduction histidine kinase
MDLVLPDSTLDESIETLRALSSSMPIIALTSIENDQITEQLLGAGIQDYVAKDDMSASLISRVCRYAIQRQQHVLQNARLTSDLQAFCHSLSHNFLSNIHQITQVTELLKSSIQHSHSLSDDSERWFNFLDQSTRGIETLVNNLRLLLSIGASTIDFQPVHLKPLIKGIEDFLRNSLDSSFQLELDNVDVTVLGDQYLLNTLFIHLLSNGIAFSESPAQLKVVGRRIDGFQMIEIIDAGIGFKSERLNDAFKPFERLESKSDGAGLGLAICKKIIDKHNGNISIASEYGQGSTIQLSFPILIAN